MISYKLKRAFLLNSFKFDNDDELLSENEEKRKVIGVDLGQAYLVYYSITGSHSRGDISLSYSWKDKIKGIWAKKSIHKNL